MSITLTNISTYVETVGRRLSLRKWNTLDSLEMVYTGPTALANDWVPKVGSICPAYPLMTCEGVELLSEVAALTTIRVTYTGKLYGMGPIALGSSVHWGESSYTKFSGQVNQYLTTAAVPESVDANGNDVPGSPPVYTFEFVSYTYTVRYQISTATYRTISKLPYNPIGGPGGGVIFQETQQTARIGAPVGIGLIDSSLTFPNVMIDRQVTPLDNGWFEISESWGPQPTIETTLVNDPIKIYTTVFN
jgi:hypothetical protein